MGERLRESTRPKRGTLPLKNGDLTASNDRSEIMTIKSENQKTPNEKTSN